MPRHVRECLTGDVQQLASRMRREVERIVRQCQLDLDYVVLAHLVRKGNQQPGEIGAINDLRPETDDELAQIGDRAVERIDRPVDALRRFGTLALHQFRHVFERQRDPVERLDDSVVEVLPDALPFIDDREVLDGLMQSGVLHRDPGMQSEQLDNPLVVLAELACPDLVGQVQVADRSILQSDRHAEEGCHRWVIGREPEARRMAGDVRDPQRSSFVDDQPEQTVALRQCAKRFTLFARDTAGDEPLDATLVGADTKSRVARTDKRPHSVHDELEHGFHREDARDRSDGVAEGLDGGPP